MIKLFSILFINILLIASCDSEVETQTNKLLPKITLSGKKVDTVTFNSNYIDDKPEVLADGKCADAVIAGSVNTSKPGTYYINYDYTDSTGVKAATVTRTVHVILTHNDSIKITEALNMYKKIDIAKHWKTSEKVDKRIVIEMGTKPEITLYYNNNDLINFFKLTEVKNQNGRLILKTTAQICDSIFIWTFNPVNKTKGMWSLQKPQLKYNASLGTFFSTEN